MERNTIIHACQKALWDCHVEDGQEGVLSQVWKDTGWSSLRRAVVVGDREAMHLGDTGR